MRALLLTASLLALVPAAASAQLPYDPLAIAVGVATAGQPSEPKPKPREDSAPEAEGAIHRPIKGGGYVIEETTDDDRRVCVEEHNPKMEEQRHRFWMQDLEMIAATKADDMEAGLDRENDLAIFVKGEQEDHALCLRRTAGTRWAKDMAPKPAGILHSAAADVEHGPSQTDLNEKLSTELSDARRELDRLYADRPPGDHARTPEIIAAEQRLAAADKAYADNLRANDPEAYREYLEREARSNQPISNGPKDISMEPGRPGSDLPSRPPTRLPEYDGPAGSGPGAPPVDSGAPTIPGYTGPAGTGPSGPPGSLPPLSKPPR